MLNPADVTNLQCVLFNKIYEVSLKDAYGIDCDASTILAEIELVCQYLDLLSMSPLVCRSLECKVLELLDKYTITLCTRDTTRLNSR